MPISAILEIDCHVETIQTFELLTVHSICSKHTIHYQSNLFRPSNVILWQEVGFQNSPWRSS